MHTLDDGPVVAAPRSGHLRDRVDDFRIILGARQEADAILAEATEVRRVAGLQAERLVAEAEAVSRGLTNQARLVLDQATGEARERADDILAAARASAEDTRRRAAAQVATDREAFRAEMVSARREQVSARGHIRDEALADIENTIRSLGTTLREAQGSVADAEGAIDLRRAQTAGRLSDTNAGPPANHFARAAGAALSTTHLASVASEPASQSRPEPVSDVMSELTVAPHRDERPEEDTELRPLGWLFRSDRS